MNNPHNGFEFNHLKNLCEFLTNVDGFNKCFCDDDTPYDRDEATRLFSEHIFNLLTEVGIDTELADTISDKLTKAFYHE